MISDLQNIKCSPCSGKTEKLNSEEISKYLSKLDNWALNDNNEMIYKKFQFKTLNLKLKIKKFEISNLKC